MFFSEGYQNLIKVFVSVFTVLLLFVVSFVKEGITFKPELSVNILGGLLLVANFLFSKRSRWGKRYAFILSLPFSILIYGLLPGVMVALALEKGYRFTEKRWLDARDAEWESEVTDEEFYLVTAILISIITWLSTEYSGKFSPFLAAVLFSNLTVLFSEFISEYISSRKKEKILISDTYSFYLLTMIATLAGLSAQAINIYGGVISISFMFAIYSIIRFSDERLSYPESKELLVELARNMESESFEADNLSGKISNLSSALGKELSLGDREISALNLVSFLSVLPWAKFPVFQYRRMSELSAQEKTNLAEKIKKSSEIVQRAGFGDEIREALSSVYENFDGSGIPEGRKGEEIPLLSRIVSVAETYEILTSQVSEGDEAAANDALKQIKNLEGKRFDPQVVRKLELISGIEPDLVAEVNAFEESALKPHNEKEEGIKSHEKAEKEGEEEG